ncbi:hypothetical protein DYI95_001675 [Thermaerobacter sp. PB12/4term]|uniref:hypothetical protein n=1 Tax=Thermaerobacter sp. PB12/4term TaxID=2293838 RepID=UPI000E325A34|nr:hypothetical protein [Thermaerobacter sp. PB12/4term]QIA26413.1 hypothetical protein DYI95_001675 [Thermaerobacter sp. PB12/4term]
MDALRRLWWADSGGRAIPGELGRPYRPGLPRAWCGGKRVAAPAQRTGALGAGGRSGLLCGPCGRPGGFGRRGPGRPSRIRWSTGVRPGGILRRMEAIGEHQGGG